MKYLSIIILIFSIVLSSCEHGAAKLDINNIEVHRAYQDSILNQNNDPNIKISALKSLITEYRNLKIDNKDSNANYLYLMGRLYSTLFSNKEFPFNGFIFDTLTNKLRDSDLYINYVDSSLYYNEQALKKNPNDIKAMYNFCNVWYSELYYFGIKGNQNISIPYSYIRDKNRWNSRLNYILNNSTKFYSIDTSLNKETSQYIIAIPYTILISDINVDTFNYTLEDNLNKIIKWFEIFSTLNKFKNFSFTKDQVSLNNKFLNIYLKAIEIVEENRRLAKKRENINSFGSQYIGSWDSDYAILKVFNDGTYTVHHYSPNPEDGQGVWDCTSNSITFTRTKGAHIAFMYEEVYHSESATLDYRNVFAPTLCKNGPDGHVDFCFHNHEN
jgi:hypothetical protein